MNADSLYLLIDLQGLEFWCNLIEKVYYKMYIFIEINVEI